MSMLAIGAQVENRSFFKEFGIGMDAGAGLIMFPVLNLMQQQK